MITIKELIDQLTHWNILITGNDYFDVVEGREHAKASVIFMVGKQEHQITKIEEVIPECDDDYDGGVYIHLA